MRYLSELDERGYRYYFLYTLMHNPRLLEPKSPSYQKALKTFRHLSERIGREKVIWRYDPIVFTGITDATFHMETYRRIAKQLNGCTNRSIISMVDIYRKARKRLKLLEEQGISIMQPPKEKLDELIKGISASAATNGIKIQTCAENSKFTSYGIQPGKCIDDKLIRHVFGLEVTRQKDPSQRSHCGCVASRDIGMYDTCLFGCCYCYATTSFDHARERHMKNDPHSPSLTGFFREE